MRRRHPSGRPIHREVIKANPYTLFPLEEPLTPRLRETQETVEAIGFVTDLDNGDTYGQEWE